MSPSCTRVALVCLSILLATSCSSSKKIAPSPPASMSSAPPSTLDRPLPSTWRLAPPGELNQTVLWVSHILIRKADSQDGASLLRSRSWTPEPPSTRSDDAAKQLAQKVANLARENPQTFPGLAARYSEDEVTRTHGGSLGPLRASMLPSPFLDVIETMTPGEVSRVVETSLGYHILLWRNPPPNVRLAGRRIAIRYAGTQGQGTTARSRADALALAQRILGEARAAPAFEKLLEQYSESEDRALGGDLGTWSTHDPMILEPLAIEALAKVSVGEVASELVESVTGFSILQRTAPRDPTALAAEIAAFGFDPEAADSKKKAEQVALELNAKALRDPEAIRDYGHEPIVKWIDGHGQPTFTAALRRLVPGQVTPVPVEIHGAYAVLRRVAADAMCPDPPVQYALPKPRVAPLALLDQFVTDSQPAQLAYSLGQLDAVVGPALTGDEKSSVKRVFTDLGTSFATADTAEKRLAAYHSALAALYTSLSEARYAQVTGLLQRWVSQQMLEVYRP